MLEKSILVGLLTGHLIQQSTRFVVPFMQIFGLYVIAHGHYSPGGGFQGGVILGASIILMAMTGERIALTRMTEDWF